LQKPFILCCSGKRFALIVANMRNTYIQSVIKMLLLNFKTDGTKIYESVFF